MIPGSRVSLFGQESDPYWNYVVALLHFDGSNGGTTFTDEKGHTFTAYGSAVTSTTQIKFGTASGYLEDYTTQSNYIDTPANADFAFGTGDWTVEQWVYWISSPNYGCLIETRISDVTNNGIYLFTDSTGTVGSYGGAPTTTGTLTANAWNFVVHERESGVEKIWINGTFQTSVADTRNHTANNLLINKQVGGTLSCKSYRDDIRITKGAARYPGTANFAIPSHAFPNR